MMAVRGLSCSMLASSKMTSRSRPISSGSNVERKAMSASSSTPISSASLGSVR
jgi:hypothetical protein